MINVTQTYLPPLEQYTKYLEGIWDRGWLTNNGPLVVELEENLKEYLGVKHLFFVTNGTIALQIAIKALDLKGEVITTPFSYVATTSSLVWEACKPIFVDIDPDTLTLNPSKIEGAITKNTSAILATHVYGIPCNVERIEAIAKRHNLKVIYDAAHAFGVQYKDTSLLNFGEVSTLSFHATKLFHTIEGGAIVTNDDELAHRISYMRNFGHKGQEDFWGVGINGKSSEVHAAMGLCVLPNVGDIMANRKFLSETYNSLFKEAGLLNKYFSRPVVPEQTLYNHSYYPLVFDSEDSLLIVKNLLNASFIYPRRYFYPSLNKINYVNRGDCRIAEDISKRALCLPLYYGLSTDSIKQIVKIIKEGLLFK